MVNSLGNTVSRTDLDSRTTRNGVGSYADVVERLFGEFEDRYPLSVIVDTVQECRAQLSCETAMPELLERLGRQRLGTSQSGADDMTPPVALAATLPPPGQPVWVIEGGVSTGVR